MASPSLSEVQHIDQREQLRAERKTSASARATYLEQAGDMTVVNSFLKISLLVLAAALLVSMGVSFAIVQHYKDFRPIVVRVDSVGKAEAVKYGDATYHPEEKELRYFLSQWVQYYYGRNRFTVKQDFPKSFFFMDEKLASNIINGHQQSKDIEQFLSNPTAPNVYVEVNQITLDHLSQAPYTGTVDFTAKQVAPYSDEVVSTQRYTVSVQFDIRPDVPNSLITVNPLGFTILAFHDAQAFN